MFLFKSDELFTSIYSYFVLVVCGLFLFQIKKISLNEQSKKWILFFSDAIVLFVIIIISKWTFLNNTPRRYFTCTYISFFCNFITPGQFKSKKILC